ncbi:hypothetical protein NKH77_39270 [Streptomyces sp. M19]
MPHGQDPAAPDGMAALCVLATLAAGTACDDTDDTSAGGMSRTGGATGSGADAPARAARWCP